MDSLFDRFLNILLVFFVVELGAVALILHSANELVPFTFLILLIINGALLLILWAYAYYDHKRRIVNIQTILGKESKELLLNGDSGIVILNDDYVVTWMSDFFDNTMNRFIGEKITSWLPAISGLLLNKQNQITINYKNRIFEVSRFQTAHTLFFKDVTKLQNTINLYEQNKIVLGLAHLDNYEEEALYADEKELAKLDAHVKQPLLDWANANHIFIRKIQQSRYLLVLNEKILKQLKGQNFDIVNKIRESSSLNDSSITLSMAFAHGNNDALELEKMINQGLELTQGRGGDQVAVMHFDQGISYYGLGSMNNDRDSKVRARIMSQTISKLILNAENVIIVGHKTMDFDCFGSAIGMASIVSKLQRPVSILTLSGGVEEKLDLVLKNNWENLNQRYDLIDEDRAIELIKPSTLVIMVDHHLASVSNGAKLLTKAPKIAVIDHHRRTQEFEFNPILAYMETSASSCCEMIVELFQYLLNKITIVELDATIMFTGMMIDTNHFRMRSSARTFDALSYLRQNGADPTIADEFVIDNYYEFSQKSQLMAMAKKVDQYMIVTASDHVFERGLLSQVADECLNIAGVEASFVIGNIGDNRVGVTARSKQSVNVQLIMEKLGGGGHFNAAAYQTNEFDVLELEDKIMKIIKGDVVKNESNIIG